jgi:hypothetical protein
MTAQRTSSALNLAPDIQRAIIEGRHPASPHLERLIQVGPPLFWSEQRRLLGLTD